MEITLIGAGNVATNLGKALVRAGHEVVAVVSRTEQSAKALANVLGCQAFTIDAFVPVHSELYVLSVKDDVLDEISTKLLPLDPNSIWVHTAGSMPLSILEGKGAKRVGVFYPMQTFSKSKEVDFSKISIFLEGNDCMNELRELASTLTTHIYPLSSEGRKHLHLAAVFACNFTNHCYALSEEVLQKVDIPFDVMLPLIDETAQKVHSLSPRDAQTGPAIRHDYNVMQRQHDLLESNKKLQQIYDILSKNIEEK